jgi:hypothetical protein
MPQTARESSTVPKRGLRMCEYDWLASFYQIAGTRECPARNINERDLLREVAALRPDLLEMKQREIPGRAAEITFYITPAGVFYLTGTVKGR